MILGIEFMSKTINEWVRTAYENSKAHGFHDGESPRDPRVIATKLALIHGELFEALEEIRAGRSDLYYNAPPGSPPGPRDKPEGFGIELADVALRLFDLAGSLGIDLEAMIATKHAYNITRPIIALALLRALCVVPAEK